MIIVFDAHCLLCSAWVQFLLTHDRRGVFRYASMQTKAGQALLARAGLDVHDLDTILLVDGERHYRDTSALLRIAHQLGFPWRLAWGGWLMPAILRDAAYKYVARNRYRIFGRRETCFLPAPQYRLRFIDDDAPGGR